MAARGTIQAPGMMRHGPFPSLAPAVHRPLEPLPPPELLETKIAVQGAELDTLARENQRLAATHGTLRQELVIAQQEMQRLHSRVSSDKIESDLQMRGLLEKIARLEEDVQAGERVRKELQQAHLEAQSLVTVRQDLTSQMQQMTEELEKALADFKRLPELHAELDSLGQEHQKLRAAFEYEKGSNIDQVKQMHVMEKNLISMAREVEKLRAEVLNAEKKAQAPNTYESSFGSADPAYPAPAASQTTNYANIGYGQSASQTEKYANSNYGQGLGYGSSSYSHTGGYPTSNYPDAYGRAPVLGSGMAAEGTGSYGGLNSFGLYNAPRGTPPSA
uniref:Cortactin-binding protein 2 n=2 Tax=Anthurium amnicola TaxID=1678845 RepID=A0A1D1YAM3_9ARAE